MRARVTTRREHPARAKHFLFRRRTWVRILTGVVVLLGLVYLGLAATLPVDHDEVEHSHAAFRILNGQVPYRDFYQNHLPTYWLLGAWWVRLFPFSVNAILAARAFNLLALAGCWVLGLRLVGSIRGGATKLGLAVYTFAVITLACELDFQVARPDPLMALIATAGLCLIPLRGPVSNARALALGLLFGLSVSVSPKAAPMALVAPALIVLACIGERRIQPVAALVPYGLGVGVAVLPTAWWVFREGLFDAFRFDVLGLNGALAKPWYLSFAYLLIPTVPASILGAVARLQPSGRRLSRQANAPLVIALALAAGLALAVLSRHDSPYNLQVLIVPMAVGFVSVVLLCLHVRSPAYQVLLCTVLIAYPAIHAEARLVRLAHEARTIPLRDMQVLMDLAKPGDRTCTAFSPAHPVFCRDASGLSNGWDLFFVEGIRDPRQLERLHRLWHDGIGRTVAGKPDIVVRRSPDRCWERALSAGLITREELRELDALRPLYFVMRVGSREVWVRQSR